MTDPIRSALKRLLSAVLDGLGQDDHPMGWARVDDAIDAARAALAEPDGPTLQLPEQAPDEHPPSNLDRREVAAWYHGHACGWQAARAALARFGHQPAPPVEGEVGELPPRPPIKGPPEHPWLVRYGVTWQGGRNEPLLTPRHDGYWTPWFVAADLLEQRHPTPVPVTERLPGPEDCDAEGFCWWFSPADPSAGTFGVAACWVLRKHEPEDDFRTHWLPATALPLPSGEVE